MRKEAIVGTEYERNERPADSTVAPHSARRYPATQGRANVREGLAMDEDDPRFKRQSLYTPPPGRDTKRSKSEESMRQHNLDEELLQDSPSKQIGDVLHDLKDMTDDFNQQQAQVRFLIWQCAERQRQEASTKISIKNWWKYELQDSRDYFAMESHRQSLIEFYAKEKISVCAQRTAPYVQCCHVRRCWPSRSLCGQGIGAAH